MAWKQSAMFCLAVIALVPFFMVHFSRKLFKWSRIEKKEFLVDVENLGRVQNHRNIHFYGIEENVDQHQ